MPVSASHEEISDCEKVHTKIWNFLKIFLTIEPLHRLPSLQETFCGFYLKCSWGMQAFSPFKLCVSSLEMLFSLLVVESSHRELMLPIPTNSDCDGHLYNWLMRSWPLPPPSLQHHQLQWSLPSGVTTFWDKLSSENQRGKNYDCIHIKEKLIRTWSFKNKLISKTLQSDYKHRWLKGIIG